MITESFYRNYLERLLLDDRKACIDIVQGLIDDGIDLKILCQDLFQRSMYEIGEMWERNRISVALEHLATSITEGALTLMCPLLFLGKKSVEKPSFPVG